MRSRNAAATIGLAPTAVSAALTASRFGGIADQALTDERIGQGGDGRAAVDAADRLLQFLQREPIAADADNARRRAGHDHGLGRGVDPAGIAGIDEAAAADPEMGQAGPFDAGRERRGAAPSVRATRRCSAGVRSNSATTTAPELPRGAATGPNGIGAGRPLEPRRAASKAASPKIGTSTRSVSRSRQPGLAAKPLRRTPRPRRPCRPSSREHAGLGKAERDRARHDQRRCTCSSRHWRASTSASNG